MNNEIVGIRLWRRSSWLTRWWRGTRAGDVGDRRLVRGDDTWWMGLHIGNLWNSSFSKISGTISASGVFSLTSLDPWLLNWKIGPDYGVRSSCRKKTEKIRGQNKNMPLQTWKWDNFNSHPFPATFSDTVKPKPPEPIQTFHSSLTCPEFTLKLAHHPLSRKSPLPAISHNPLIDVSLLFRSLSSNCL